MSVNLIQGNVTKKIEIVLNQLCCFHRALFLLMGKVLISFASNVRVFTVIIVTSTYSLYNFRIICLFFIGTCIIIFVV